MKAFVIDAVARTVEAIELDNGMAGVKALIGFDTVDSDEIDSNGDRLYFDENCFVRADPGAPKFRLDTLAPVAGRGVVVRASAGGAQLTDAVVTLEALTKRVTFT